MVLDDELGGAADEKCAPNVFTARSSTSCSIRSRRPLKMNKASTATPR